MRVEGRQSGELPEWGGWEIGRREMAMLRDLLLSGTQKTALLPSQGSIEDIG
jgi:hypothetical protein